MYAHQIQLKTVETVEIEPESDVQRPVESKAFLQAVRSTPTIGEFSEREAVASVSEMKSPVIPLPSVAAHGPHAPEAPIWSQHRIASRNQHPMTMVTK